MDNCLDLDYQLNLLTLPSLVIKDILDCLDGPELKSLRTVCKCTKSWVDDDEPSYLEKIPLYIRDEHTLEQISDSKLEWSNLVFHKVQYATGGSGSVAVIRKFGPFLKSVTIGPKIPESESRDSKTTSLIDNFLIDLEASAPRLESLKIFGQYHLSTFVPLGQGQGEGGPEPVDPMEKQRAQLQKLNFHGLRRLAIIPHFPIPADLIWPLVQVLLKACPNLDWIGIPAMALPRQSPLHDPAMTNPLIEYMTPLVQKSKTQPYRDPRRRPKFHLDFSTDRERVDSEPYRPLVKHLPPIFKFDPNTIYELSNLAFELGGYGGRLWNVPITALPTPAQVYGMSGTANFRLTNALGSVLCRNTRFGTKNLYLTFKTQLFVSLDIDERADYSNFELPAHLRVIEISVSSPPRWDWDWDRLEGKNMLLRNLFKMVREHVTSLRIRRMIPYYDLHFDAAGLADSTVYKLSTYFPALRKLSLFDLNFGTGLIAHPDERDPLRDFLSMAIRNLSSTLNELSLEKCVLRDVCFFEQPGGMWDNTVGPLVLCKLKDLTTVKLVKCDIQVPTCEHEPRTLTHGRRLEQALEALNLKTLVFKENRSFTNDEYDYEHLRYQEEHWGPWLVVRGADGRGLGI